MRRAILAFVLVLAGCAAPAQRVTTPPPAATAALPAVPLPSDPLCPLGCPVHPPASNALIHRALYTLSYNPSEKAADWVAYRIWKGSLRTGARSNKYRAEPEVAADDALDNDDYTGVGAAGFARGHQAPDASLAGADPEKTIDILSNLTPQRANLNSGVWAQLEAAERRLLDGPGAEVYSVTGPVFAANPADDLRAGLRTSKPYRVPLKYWKVIGVRSASGWRFGAFLIAQDYTSPKYCDASNITSIDRIEQESDLDLLPQLPAAEAQRLEAEIGGDLLPDLGCR